MKGLDRWIEREPPEFPCEVCGRMVDDCICPECPQCRTYGDPACYEKHGLVRSAEQIESFRKYEEWLDKQARADREWADAFAHDLEEDAKR